MFGYLYDEDKEDALSPGVVTKDAAGEGRWSDRGAGPLTGLRVRQDSGGDISQVSAR